MVILAVILCSSMFYSYTDMGVSENVVYPIVPNGFADHYPYEKWLAMIGNMNPTFSGPNPYDEIWPDSKSLLASRMAFTCSFHGTSGSDMT